jgi:hypothetical protein
MRKSIIAQAIESVNHGVESLDKFINAAREKRQFVSRDTHKELTDLIKCQGVLDELIDAKFHSWSDVVWELDDGDSHITSKLVLSAMRTAYTALYHSWCREAGLYDDAHQTPAEQVQQEEVEEASGLYHDNFDVLSYEDALRFAEAVYAYATHIANYKDGKYRWLLSMDVTENGEQVTKNFLLPFKQWAIQQATESKSKKRSEFMKLASEGVGEDWKHTHIDEAKSTVRVWLNEPVDDGTYHCRAARIIERVADRRYEAFIEAFLARNPYRVMTQAASWELILASPQAKQDVELFKATREYKLLRLERLAQELEYKQALEAEMKRLDTIEQRLMDRLAKLEGKSEEPAQVEEPEQEPEEEVKVTVLPSMDSLSWRDRLEMIKAQRH